MKNRFEAKTLEEACKIASIELECSIDTLEYDIIQYPSKGIFGLFAKNAVILIKKYPKKEQKTIDKNSNKVEKKADTTESIEKRDTSVKKVEKKITKNELDDSSVIDSFYKKRKVEDKIETITAPKLEEEIKRLFSSSCYDLDTIEVDIEDNTAYVFIDGVDAALLIGKEGYRYNALSYLLFNWINNRYGLYLKLEIAQFLASQQDMIVNQLKSVVDHVNREGWGRTRELNGILVQIALEYLRDTFPNKYVAIKRTKSGERYIVINEFNKR